MFLQVCLWNRLKKYTYHIVYHMNIGGVVLRPYVPHGTKWIGEGEGEPSVISIMVYPPQISCSSVVEHLNKQSAGHRFHPSWKNLDFSFWKYACVTD